MNKTENFGLNLPDYDEFADIADLNDNAKIIDAELKTIDEKASGIDVDLQAAKGRITTVEGQVGTVNTDLQLTKTNLNNHKATAVPAAGGAHGLRYHNDALEYWNGVEWVEAQAGGDFIPMSEKGAPNGVATLDANGMVASALVNAYTKPETADTPTKALFGKPATALPTEIFEKLSAAALIRRTPLTTKVSGPISSFALNSTVYISENGVMVPYIVVKHNYEPGLNISPRTLLVRKYLTSPSRQWHTSNVNAYATSAIDAWLNGEYLNSLSPTLRAAISQTKFPYTPGNGNITVSSISRSVALLSATEYGITHAQANVEGAAVSNASSLRPAADEAGNYQQHWTRSPNIDSTNFVFEFNSGASFGAVQPTSTGRYARPVFAPLADYMVTWYVDSSGRIVENPEMQNNIENALGTKLGNVIHMEQFTYTGTGTFGQANPNTVITGFTPHLVIVTRMAPNGTGGVPWIRPQSEGLALAASAQPTMRAALTWGTDRISWYATTFDTQLNASGVQYTVTAIGLTTNEEG